MCIRDRVLRASEVWSVVGGNSYRPDEDEDDPAPLIAWEKLDSVAQAIIVPLLDARQTNHIFSCETARDMWEKLDKIHSDSSSLNKQHTLSKFYTFQIPENKSIVDGFTEIEELARNLKDMGLEMPEEAVVTKVVSSLPHAKYNAFRKAWDSVPEDDQSMENLLARLKKEELEEKQYKNTGNGDSETTTRSVAFNAQGSGQRNGNTSNGQRGARALTREQKKDMKCNHCKMKGHLKFECFKLHGYPDRQGGKNDKGERPSHSQAKPGGGGNSGGGATGAPVAYMMNNEEDLSRQSWICDSGADRHITGSKSWFTEYIDFPSPRNVTLADKSSVASLGSGTV